ncbi:MAG TPA: C25 family cysteine peptidase [Kiritimatiellia bacterium]|nr:C25 family cysteine peptidase [Kiritimatiellia bacterium]
MTTTTTIKNKLNGRSLMTSTILVCFLVVGSMAETHGQSVKVSVKEDGFYRVTKSQIAGVLNVSVSQVETMPLHVNNLGQEVASVRDNGDVVFYGNRLINRFTDENIYFIKVGQASSIPQVQVNSGTTPFADSFPFSKKIEQQLLIRADLVKDIDNQDEDPIYWRMLTSGLSTRFYNAPVSMENVKSGTGGTLSVRLKGATEVSGRYFHRARIDLNGTTLGFIDFEGLQNVEATFTVPSGLWASGNNTVRVESTPPPGTTLDSFYLDYIVVNYVRTYNATGNQLVFDGNPGSIMLTGFTGSGIRIWNVTDRWDVRALDGFQAIPDGGSWNVTYLTTSGGKYAACVNGSEKTPFSVQPGQVVDLRDTSWHLDHLTVSHPSLMSAATEIKDYRQSKGLQSALISVDDIYDSFNFGIKDPKAIQSFLSYAFRNWSRAPRYVVLVGDGSLDYRNDLGFNDSLIPSFPLVVNTGLYASDFLYGDPAGTGRVEIAVGRIPFKAVSNVTDYVQKMINYEAGGNWRTNTMIATDQSDFAGNFYGDGNALQNIIVDREVKRADIDIIGAEQTRQELIKGINSGKEMSFYVGHGTPNQLSQQSILLTQDALAFTNHVSPTAFVMLGCLVGTFGGPGNVSLGEGLMLAKGGSASLTAAATLISAADGRYMSERMLESIYVEGDARIGDAWIKGKNHLMYYGLYPAFRGFQLMGDPALAIGAADAPRPLETGDAERESYEEWVSWHVPPALQEIGFVLDPNEDLDGDLVSNGDEFIAGTNPLDSDSVLVVANIKRLTNGEVQVSWPSSNGRIYDLQASGNISGPYQLIAEDVTATAPLNILNFADSSNLRYFRVNVR